MNERESYRRQLIADGYTESHAAYMAMLAFPTAREAALVKARQARKRNAEARRQASRKTLKTLTENLSK